jgi:cephalosporin hydroxylase
MKELFKRLLGPVITAYITRIVVTGSVKKIIRKVRRRNDRWPASQAIEFLFSKKARYITPWQYREELEPLAKEIELLRPRTVLEIGTADGGTLFLAARLASEDALIISIDLPQGAFGGGYEEWKIPLYKSFGQPGQRIELIREDSHLPEVLEQVSRLLGNRKIDYLFLDGDHTYQGVYQDFNTYGKLLSGNSIVAFHDIVSDKSESPDHFVSVFWNEIKHKYDYLEFVKNTDQDKLGLGMLRITRTNPRRECPG